MLNSYKTKAKNYLLSHLGEYKLSKSLTNAIEALLFGAGRPITLSEIRNILSNNGNIVELSDIKKSLNMLHQQVLILQ